MSKFKRKVIEIVKCVPAGKVVSYGQVALYAGIPSAARQVGWTLNRLEKEIEVPWWRVVNNQGRISIKNFKYSAHDQKKLLEKEGIQIEDNLTFHIEKYRFIPDKKILDSFDLNPSYIQLILGNILYLRYFPK